MKKKYLITYLVQTMIFVSALLFPVIARSQELTDAQRLERCQNNKNRITELEAQLKIINAELSNALTPIGIEDARDDMVFIKSIRLNLIKSEKDLDMRKKGELSNITTIADQYNYNFLNCIDESFNNQQPYWKCLSKLEEIIAQKIDKARSLNKPELLAKKNEIDKQLASHRNNLVALRCDQPIVKKETDDFDYSKVSGTWQSDWGPVSLSVSKNSVSGSWKQSATETGQITGGSFDAKTKTLRFTYSQAWNKKTGRVTLVFSETSKEYNLSGPWSHDDNSGSGNWGMKKPK